MADDAERPKPLRFVIPKKPATDPQVEVVPATPAPEPTRAAAGTCPLSVGFAGLHRVRASDDEDSLDLRFLLTRGTTIANRLGPIWFPGPVELDERDAPIQLSVHNGRRERTHATKVKAGELMRGTGPWNIGLSVDANLDFYAHSRGADETSELGHSVLLGKLDPS